MRLNHYERGLNALRVIMNLVISAVQNAVKFSEKDNALVSASCANADSFYCVYWLADVVSQGTGTEMW